MKYLFLLSLLSLSFICASQNVSGFYSGTLFNDSTKMTQKYELALNDYRGKISGYSYVTFIVNDTFYYGIRKVKAMIMGDSLIVQDDKMIVNNFPEAPAKGVGRTITIPLKGQDSVVVLNGRWKTNQTKKYYSVPGAIDLNRSSDSSHSPLINHLKELNIIPSIPYQNTYAAAPAGIKDRTSMAQKDETVKVKAKEDKKKVKTESNNKGTGPASLAGKTAPTRIPYTERGNRLMQTIENSTSDSLVLAFYDNGVVDGDSISVYMNGEQVVSNARLKISATKKTLQVSNLEEITLMLVAENLGSIPPNTGLLTIKDGDNMYQVNFSADLQTNARIVIRRKKKQ